MTLPKKINENQVKAALSYCPEKGEFRWKDSDRPSLNGSIAGGHDQLGYLIIKIKGVVYKAHRLAFVLMGNKVPTFVDHIDGDPRNNKWENLRPCNTSQNSRNSKIAKDNKTGVKGVDRVSTGSYRVRIQVNGKRRQLGVFKTLSEAERAINLARAKYHKKYARRK